MFSYYGSKSKIIDYYPPPKYGKVIEPFAGSARYALKYFDRDVLLVDKYPVIVEVWNYLKNASEADIRGLPFLQKGEVIPLSLSDTERRFMGFIVADGAAAPQNKTTSFSSNPEKVKSRLQSIAKQLFKIRHWEIRLGCYTEIENEMVTWFIDPPYQFGGQHYKESNKNLNFVELAEWCRDRNGQTIVCENSKADWLPFNNVILMKGQNPIKTTEAIWSNIKTNYDNVQMGLF
jgi:site-specific DNA-adenine methylase